MKKPIMCMRGLHDITKQRWGKSIWSTGVVPLSKTGSRTAACTECVREYYKARAKIRAAKYKKDAGL
jgi:hypothetical protein